MTCGSKRKEPSVSDSGQPSRDPRSTSRQPRRGNRRAPADRRRQLRGKTAYHASSTKAKKAATSRVIQIRESPRYRVSRSTAFNKLFAMRESLELRSREGRWPRRRAFLGAGVYAGAKASLKRGQRRSNCKADHIWLGGAVQFRTPRRKFSGLPGRPLAGI